MHGSPLSKYNNRDLWEHYDYHSYGIRGEAFLSFEQDHDDIHYLTDTGRTWSNRHTLRDVMKTKPEKIIRIPWTPRMILLHGSRQDLKKNST